MFCLFCYLLIQRNVFAFSANLFRFCCKITKRIGYLMEIKSKRLQKSYQRGATRRFCYLCARYFYDSTFFFCYFAARKLNETKINLEDMDLKQFTLLIGVASLPSLATAASHCLSHHLQGGCGNSGLSRGHSSPTS
jgi:hypothetical protein